MTKTAHGHIWSGLVVIALSIVLLHLQQQTVAPANVTAKPVAHYSTAGSTIVAATSHTSAAANSPTNAGSSTTSAPAKSVATTQQVPVVPVKTAANPTPIPPPTATPAAPSPANDIATEAQCLGQNSLSVATVICSTNLARQAHALPVVTANAHLMKAAADKAADIKACGFLHTACGHDFSFWMTQDGYTSGCKAENIAEGQQDAGEVFTAWMNSAGHRANILNATYTDIGVAELATSNGPIWVMELGSSC